MSCETRGLICLEEHHGFEEYYCKVSLFQARKWMDNQPNMRSVDSLAGREDPAAKCGYWKGWLKRVSLLRDANYGEWNTELITMLFNSENGKSILRMDWLEDNREDELVWMASKDGKFSVGSCCKIITECPDKGE